MANTSRNNGSKFGSMPLWLVVLVLLYLASLSTYAILSGKKVKVSFLPPSIETGDDMDKKDANRVKNIELWTVKGVLDLKPYSDLRPQLRDHVHELLLRIKPPDFQVDEDGHFTIRNIPLKIEGEEKDPLLEIYPVRDIFSKGYRPTTFRIGQHPSSYGSENDYSIRVIDATKTIEILDKLSIKNPLKESPIPIYPSVNATRPEPVQQ